MDHEIVAMRGQTLSSVVGSGCIVWGLFAMQAAGHRRDREIDELGKGLQQQGRALERQVAAMTKAFTQQGAVLAALLHRTA